MEDEMYYRITYIDQTSFNRDVLVSEWITKQSLVDALDDTEMPEKCIVERVDPEQYHQIVSGYGALFNQEES